MIITDKAQIKIAELRESNNLRLSGSDELECYELIESDLKSADATFTRSSVAYLSDGTQVAANQPRFEQGRFGKAVLVEEGTTNLVSNPSFESGMWPELWNPSNGTATLVTGWNGSGNAARIIITIDNSQYGIISARNMSLSEGVTYTISFRARAIRDNFPITYMYLISSSVGNSRLPTINLGTTWQRYTITYTIPAGKTASDYGLMIAIDGRSAVYANDWIEVDDVQLEAKPYATTFTDGTRAAETLTIPTEGVLNPQEGTIECRFYVDNNTQISGVYRYVFATGEATNRNCMYFRRGASGDWNLDIYDANSNRTYLGITSYTLSIGWHYLAVRWQGNHAAVFIDGVLYLSTNSRVIPTNFGSLLYIGSHLSGTSQYGALIDDLRISSIARSDEEILAAYQSGKPLPVDEWTAYKLDFDDKVRITTQGQIICNELIEI